MKKLPLSFYLREDVVLIARELLGKVLTTTFNNVITAGRIVETEAYAGELDKASHASKGKTPRTGVMFDKGGRTYVYLCYGIHQMFNIVTAKQGIAHAILIRAVEPLLGKDIMMKRSGKQIWDEKIASGPGKVGKAFGFHTSQCGVLLTGNQIHISDDGFKITEQEIVSSPRIGVDYAGEHAEWHYRFYIKGNKYVSGKNK